MGLIAPEITQKDLENFHASHFSSNATSHFSATFWSHEKPNEENEEQDIYEDDGLGYYPEGVKRTLTDEQIAIFRHSEIQALLRERRRAEESKDDLCEEQKVTPDTEEGEFEEGEVPDEAGAESVTASAARAESQPNTRKAKKARYAKERGWFKQNVKPDLRKRTWDKVDAGLENLDYHEEVAGKAAKPSSTSKRRMISYDD